MDKDQLIELGYCSKAHGVQGGFSFTLHNMEDSILKDGFTVTLKPYGNSSSIDSEGIQVKIKNIKFGNKVICFLEDITDRNIVDEMMPFTIYVRRGDFPEEQADEIYLSDMIGQPVYSPETFEEIGKILSSYENGEQVVFEVELSNGKKIDVPFVPAFFPEITEDREILMIVPEEF